MLKLSIMPFAWMKFLGNTGTEMDQRNPFTKGTIQMNIRRKNMKPSYKDLILLSRIPALLKQITGQDRQAQVIHAWAKKGRIGQHGKRIYLKTYRRLGRKFTTQTDLEEFIKEL